MKWIRTMERRYIPKMRKKKAYIITKAIIYFPLAVIIYYGSELGRYLMSKLKFKRKGKPDIILKNIIAGWTNLMIDNPVVEEIAMKRANICATCPFVKHSTGVHTIIVDKKTTQIRGMVCGKCGCPLSAKVRSADDYCPAGKW